MSSITRRTVLRGGGAVVLGAGIAVTNGAMASSARQVTAKEAVADLITAFRLYCSRLAACDATPRLKQGARVLLTIFQIMEAETFGAIDQGTQERIERQIGVTS